RLYLQRPARHPHLHSFPTRRSSDLTTSSTSRTSQARCGNSTGNRGRRYPATGALAPIGYPGGRPPGYGAAAGPAAGGPEGGGVGPGAGGGGGGWLIEAPFSAERTRFSASVVPERSPGYYRGADDKRTDPAAVGAAGATRRSRPRSGAGAGPVAGRAAV